VDLGVDPTFAQKRLKELQDAGFLSKATRSIKINLVVYNNALPMFCYLTISLKVMSTGTITRSISTTSVAVQHYLYDLYWLQIIIELIVFCWTCVHAYTQVAAVYFALRPRLHMSTPLTVYNGVAVLRIAFIIAIYIVWLYLVLEQSSEVDVTTEDYVDLETIASLSQWYSLLCCIALMLTLFSTLEYFEISEKLAIISKSFAVIAQELPYFFFLFFLLFVILAYTGTLLFGATLTEFHTLESSVHTCWDMMLGNYMFSQLEPAIDPDSPASRIVAVFYFYSYVVLMLFLLLNMLIAIFMDGYTTVKAKDASIQHDLLDYNMGPLLADVWNQARYAFSRSRRTAHFHLHRAKLVTSAPPPRLMLPWSETRWLRDTQLVMINRARAKESMHVLSISTFIRNLKALPTSDGEDVQMQVKQRFHKRAFKKPSNVNRPFEELSTDEYITRVDERIGRQEEKTRELLTMMRHMYQTLCEGQEVAAAEEIRSLRRQLKERGGGSADALSPSRSPSRAAAAEMGGLAEEGA